MFCTTVHKVEAVIITSHYFPNLTYQMILVLYSSRRLAKGTALHVNLHMCHFNEDDPAPRFDS